ncbi:MAG TPA: M28 family peptidase [Gemmatimonadaceae bacterium]|nr:M28 family peptidase [Gemmatimonadaceae bacterium]
MSRLRLLPFVALLAGCATAAPITSGPIGELPRTHRASPTGAAITPADLMSRLYPFADDSMMGREAGTRGNVLATDYVAREMARIGLRPAGENGTWFQTVPILIATMDTTRTLNVEGTALAYAKDWLPFHSQNGGRNLPVGTGTRSFDGARVVYGGMVGSGNLVSPAVAEGKLVVFSVPLSTTTGRRDWRFHTFGSLTEYAGAAGFAAIALDVVPRVTLARLHGPQVFVRPDNPLPTPTPLSLLITPDAARALFGVTSLDSLTVGREGRVVSGNIEFVNREAPFPSRNVIGILPGSDPERRGQYVAVGAHNDHIGLSARVFDHDSALAFNQVARRQGAQDTLRAVTPAEAARIVALRDSLTKAHGGARPDSVYNGADDDGSGTVALLEIAEAFARAGQAPRRSMLFVSHTGEEKGLWGSQWFTDHPTVPRDSIVAQLNMDMVGRGKPTDVMGRGPNNIQLIGVRRLSTQLGDLVDSVNSGRTPRMDIDLTFDANGHPLNRYCRSDHYMYARYGIPIAYFSLGYHTDYHQITDEAQYIDYEHMARVAQFVHDVAAGVAERRDRLVVDKPKPDPRGTCRQ